jgi:hypothetical protein
MANFSLSEPTAASMSGQTFGLYAIGALPAPIHEIARLLTGSIDLAIDGSETALRQRRNFLSGGAALSSPRSIVKSISEGITEDDYKRCLQTNRFKNIAFFTSLRDEISRCVYSINQGDHVESFVYVYRCIEHLAEACGILYVTYQDDFGKSIKFFKDIYNNENMGPIGLLSSTAKSIASSEHLGDVYFDYEPILIDPAIMTAVKVQLIRIGIKTTDNVNFTWEESEGYKIAVKFEEVPSFISNIRNRTYHNQNSYKNIELHKIGGLSGLASMLTAPTLSWVATMYFTLLRALVVRSSSS